MVLSDPGRDTPGRLAGSPVEALTPRLLAVPTPRSQEATVPGRKGKGLSQPASHSVEMPPPVTHASHALTQISVTVHRINNSRQGRSQSHVPPHVRYSLWQRGQQGRLTGVRSRDIRSRSSRPAVVEELSPRGFRSQVP